MKRDIIKYSAITGIVMIIYFIQQMAAILIGDMSIVVVVYILAYYIYESLTEHK